MPALIFISLFGIVIVLCPPESLARHAIVRASRNSQQITSDMPADLYGLYYATCDEGDEQPDCPALVISKDEKSISLKENDTASPTHPGLHVGQRLFPFAWSRFSLGGFAFRTARVGHTAYSFQGRFGREDVDVISDVPYLTGVLTVTRHHRVVRRKKVHFAHAVIL